MQALLINMELCVVDSSNTKKSKWRWYIYIVMKKKMQHSDQNMKIIDLKKN